MDTITNDLQGLIKDYIPSSGESQVQDGYSSKSQSRKDEIGSDSSKSEFKGTSKNPSAKVDSSDNSNVAKSITDGNTSVVNTFNNNAKKAEFNEYTRHNERIKNDIIQNKETGRLNGTMDSVYRLMYNEYRGPKLKEREKKASEHDGELAAQLAAQHEEQMKMLKSIRNRSGGGGMFGGIGGFGGGTGGKGKGKGKGKGPTSPGGGGGNKFVKAAKWGAGLLGTAWLGNEAMQWMGDTDREQRQRSREEVDTQYQRNMKGLKPIEGQELISLRKKITESKGKIANPKAGFPINTLQQTAINSGLYTVADVTAMDPADLYDDMQQQGIKVEISALGDAKDSQSFSAFTNGMSGTETALVGGVTATSAAVAYKNRSAISGKISDARQNVSNKVQSGRDKVNAAKRAVVNKAVSTKQAMTNVGKAVANSNVTQSVVNSQAGQAVKQGVTGGVSAVQNAVPDATKTKVSSALDKVKNVGGKGLEGLKKIPIIGTALTAYTAHEIWTNDQMTTGEKVGETADLAGGIAGGWAGAELGAMAGAFAGPVGIAVGGLIGGIAGYTLGDAGVETVREAVGSFFSDEEDSKDEEAEEVNAKLAKASTEVQGPEEVTQIALARTEAKTKREKKRKQAQSIMDDPSSSATTRRQAQKQISSYNKEDTLRKSKPKDSSFSGSKAGSNNTLGIVSAAHETREGVGTVSSGIDDPGGVSYGTYQLSSEKGMVADYLSTSKYSDKLTGDINSPEFKASWKKLAKEDPEGFEKDQHDFIKDRSYVPVRNDFARQSGLDPETIDNMAGLSNALWSQSVQHGQKGNSQIIKNAVATAGKKADEGDYVNALYGARSAYVQGLSSLNARTKGSIQNRYAQEVQDAQSLVGLKTGSDKSPVSKGAAKSSAVVGASSVASAAIAGTGTGKMGELSAEESLTARAFSGMFGISLAEFGKQASIEDRDSSDFFAEQDRVKAEKLKALQIERKSRKDLVTDPYVSEAEKEAKLSDAIAKKSYDDVIPKTASVASRPDKSDSNKSETMDELAGQVGPAINAEQVIPIGSSMASSLANEYIGDVSSKSLSGSKISSTPLLAANVSSQAINEEDTKRKQFESVKKVMMLDNGIAKKESGKKDLTKPPRSPSTASFSSATSKSSINETPMLIADHGLMLLNTGYI